MLIKSLQFHSRVVTDFFLNFCSSFTKVTIKVFFSTAPSKCFWPDNPMLYEERTGLQLVFFSETQ